MSWNGDKTSQRRYCCDNITEYCVVIVSAPLHANATIFSTCLELDLEHDVAEGRGTALHRSPSTPLVELTALRGWFRSTALRIASPAPPRQRSTSVFSSRSVLRCGANSSIYIIRLSSGTQSSKSSFHGLHEASSSMLAEIISEIGFETFPEGLSDRLEHGLGTTRRRSLQ